MKIRSFGASSILRSCCLLLASVLAAMLLAPSAALAKSYTMPFAKIEAQILADGSMDVRETREWSFEGSYTRVFWTLDPPPDGRIEGISVVGAEGRVPTATVEGRPAGTVRVVPEGKQTRVDVYGDFADKSVTYTLFYRITNAAVRWEDTAELLWQCVGRNWEVGTGSFDAAIKPPPGVAKADVKAWAHGPLTGVVRIQPDASVTLLVTDLPANTFVEPRIIFPASALPAAKPHPQAKRAQILAEEAALANKANEQRRAAKSLTTVFLVCGFGFPLLLLVVMVVLFFRYGKEHKPAFRGQYFREPPADLHPALVGYLWSMGKVEDNVISASLMDLADRGVIRMEPVTVPQSGIFGEKQIPSFLLTLDRSKWNDVGPLDRDLLSFLFDTVAGDDTLTLEELKKSAKDAPSEFQHGIENFKQLVGEEADRQGFVEAPSRTARVWAWVITSVTVIFAVVAMFAAEQFGIVAVAAPIVVAMIVMSVNMTRRSSAAVDLFAKYVALRNYLRDFSRLKEAPLGSVVLWNKFLVLAVVFGIAEQVIEQLRVAIPQVVSDPAFATTYWWLASGPGYNSPISSLSGGFTSAASIASSELSSASGGGGGFSGGGGGGFGGGGGGGAD